LSVRPQKRSFTIKGHRTSISLEAPFWDALREIAERRNLPLAALVAEIDSTRGHTAGLSTAVRLHILADLRRRASSADQEEE
jgi:predicted DNA-binding ribbon-helix-helix protein